MATISTPQGTITGQTFTDAVTILNGATGTFVGCTFLQEVNFGGGTGLEPLFDPSTIVDGSALRFEGCTVHKSVIGWIHDAYLDFSSPSGSHTTASKLRGLVLGGWGNTIRGSIDIAGTGFSAFFGLAPFHDNDLDGLVCRGGQEENVLFEWTYYYPWNTGWATVTGASGNTITLAGGGASVRKTIFVPAKGYYYTVTGGTATAPTVDTHGFPLPTSGDVYVIAYGFTGNSGAITSYPTNPTDTWRGFGYGCQVGLVLWGCCAGNDFSGSRVVCDNAAKAYETAGFVDVSVMVASNGITTDCAPNFGNKLNGCTFTDSRANKTKSARGALVGTAAYAPTWTNGTPGYYRPERAVDPRTLSFYVIGGRGGECKGGRFDGKSRINFAQGYTWTSAVADFSTKTDGYLPQNYIENAAALYWHDGGEDPAVFPETLSYVGTEPALNQYAMTLTDESYLADSLVSLPLEFDLWLSIAEASAEVGDGVDAGSGADSGALASGLPVGSQTERGKASDAGTLENALLFDLWPSILEAGIGAGVDTGRGADAGTLTKGKPVGESMDAGLGTDAGSMAAAPHGPFTVRLADADQGAVLARGSQAEVTVRLASPDGPASRAAGQ